MWQGSMVAIVTPFKNNRLDEERVKDLVEFHVVNNTKAIVPSVLPASLQLFLILYTTG